MPLSDDPEKRARQLANLKPSPPGETHNPNGYNGRPFASALMKRAKPGDWSQLADVVWACALSGQPWAVREIGDRADGKSVQKNEDDVNIKGGVEIYLPERKPAE